MDLIDSLEPASIVNNNTLAWSWIYGDISRILGIDTMKIIQHCKPDGMTDVEDDTFLWIGGIFPHSHPSACTENPLDLFCAHHESVVALLNEHPLLKNNTWVSVHCHRGMWSQRGHILFPMSYLNICVEGLFSGRPF